MMAASRWPRRPADRRHDRSTENARRTPLHATPRRFSHPALLHAAPCRPADPLILLFDLSNNATAGGRRETETNVPLAVP